MPARRKSNVLRALHGERPRVSPVHPTSQTLAEPPAWLDRDGKAEWKRVVTQLKRHDGFLDALDRAALAAYCMTWSTWLAAAKDVAKRGPLVPGRSSADAARSEDDEPVLVKNPSVQIMRDASIQLRYWCREFGFTPDSRSKLDMPSPSAQAQAARYLLS